jgi:hypothetical protein
VTASHHFRHRDDEGGGDDDGDDLAATAMARATHDAVERRRPERLPTLGFMA